MKIPVEFRDTKFGQEVLDLKVIGSQETIGHIYIYMRFPALARSHLCCYQRDDAGLVVPSSALPKIVFNVNHYSVVHRMLLAEEDEPDFSVTLKRSP